VDNGEPEEGENEPADDDEPAAAEVHAEPAAKATNGEKQQVTTTPGGGKMLLHKTASIFLRNLSPAITKNDIEAVHMFHL